MEQLKNDVEAWKWLALNHEDCPESEFEEVLKAIRVEWKDVAKREDWINVIRDKAKAARFVMEPNKGITERIRNASKTHQNGSGAAK